MLIVGQLRERKYLFLPSKKRQIIFVIPKVKLRTAGIQTMVSIKPLRSVKKAISS